MATHVPGSAAVPVIDEATGWAGHCHLCVTQGLGLVTAHRDSAHGPSTDLSWQCPTRVISGESTGLCSLHCAHVSVPREGKWL